MGIMGCSLGLPNVMDLLHFMEIFLARRSNQVPSLWPPVASELKVLDFCRLLMSKAVVMLTMFFANKLVVWLRVSLGSGLDKEPFSGWIFQTLCLDSSKLHRLTKTNPNLDYAKPTL
jgi:hypothetical protein